MTDSSLETGGPDHQGYFVFLFLVGLADVLALSVGLNEGNPEADKLGATGKVGPVVSARVVGEVVTGTKIVNPGVGEEEG